MYLLPIDDIVALYVASISFAFVNCASRHRYLKKNSSESSETEISNQQLEGERVNKLEWDKRKQFYWNFDMLPQNWHCPHAATFLHSLYVWTALSLSLSLFVVIIFVIIHSFSLNRNLSILSSPMCHHRLCLLYLRYFHVLSKFSQLIEHWFFHRVFFGTNIFIAFQEDAILFCVRVRRISRDSIKFRGFV